MIGGITMKTRDLVICALFAALIAVLAQISIPLPGGVPLTMQTLAISLAGIILGSKRGTVSVCVYVLMGAFGLPVFAGFTGGLSIIVGPTGGFILSFPIMAYIIGKFSERTDNKVTILLGSIIGSIPNYIIGAIQFAFITNSSLYAAFIACVAPFIIVGLIKAALSTTIGTMIKNHSGLKGILLYD